MPEFDFRDDRSWWNEQANWKDQARDRLEGSMVVGQEEQMRAYSQVAQEGLYGDINLGEIMQGSSAERAAQKKQWETYLDKKLGRRLRGRAGGAREVMMANQFTAPQYANEIQQRRNLRKEHAYKNAQSKLAGLMGRDRNLDNMLRQLGMVIQEDMNSENNETGVLDWVNALSDVISAATGGGGAGGGGLKLRMRSLRLFGYFRTSFQGKSKAQKLFVTGLARLCRRYLT